MTLLCGAQVPESNILEEFFGIRNLALHNVNLSEVEKDCIGNHKYCKLVLRSYKQTYIAFVVLATI